MFSSISWKSSGRALVTETGGVRPWFLVLQLLVTSKNLFLDPLKLDSLRV